MRLIVGLGNPGLRFRSTRHNMGFMAVDKFSRTSSIRLRRKEHNTSLGRGNFKGEEVVLAKPLTYMNLSGKAVAQVLAKEGLSPERMMVVCDDADLPLGTIRMRPKGNSGGHNGLASIAENLETTEFPRLKIGIGRTVAPGLTGHVLGPFKKADSKAVDEVLDRAVQALNMWITDGIQAAMTRYNA